MKEPLDDTRIRSLLQRLPQRTIPTDLVAAIEAETVFKRHWWESDVFQTRWLPAFVGIATAVGALWLSKAHVNPRPEALIPIAARPSSEPVETHAFLPHSESLNQDKGDSREN